MNAPEYNCPLCFQGNLEICVENQTINYKGQSLEVPYKYSVCNTCGSEQADAGLLKANKRAVLAIKKSRDQLLSGEEVKRIRQMYNLRQSDASKIFGGGPTAFSKYESDDVIQSESMDKLLRVARKFPEVLAFLKNEGGIETATATRNQTSILYYRRDIFTKRINSGRTTLAQIGLLTHQKVVEFNLEESAANGHQFDQNMAL